MKTTIQKATYTGKKTGVLLEVEYARYFNDGCNNPKITVEGTVPCQSKRRITLTLNAPLQQSQRRNDLSNFLSSNCVAFGMSFAAFLNEDKFKKYGVYIDGNFYKVATLDDLLVVKQAMGI